MNRVKKRLTNDFKVDLWNEGFEP